MSVFEAVTHAILVAQRELDLQGIDASITVELREPMWTHFINSSPLGPLPMHDSGSANIMGHTVRRRT